jgi:hypothetical protein
VRPRQIGGRGLRGPPCQARAPAIRARRRASTLRGSGAQITLYQSLGFAAQDLAVAATDCTAAISRDVGARV